jgi:8-oxo-dGTP pyrophosphatase MutT (NUDIX family)
MHKQSTASIYLFKKIEGAWHVALIFHKKLDYWLAPGGHVEENENTEECALRELYEETGLKGELISFREAVNLYSESRWAYPAEFIYDQIIPAHKNDAEHIHSDSTYFAISKSEEDVSIQVEEISRFHWCKEQEVKDLKTFIGVKNIIVYCFDKLKKGEIYFIKDYRNGVKKYV